MNCRNTLDTIVSLVYQLANDLGIDTETAYLCVGDRLRNTKENGDCLLETQETNAADNDTTEIDIIAEEHEYNAREAAKILTVHVETLRRWIREGKIKCGRPRGGIGYVITQKNLDDFMAMHKMSYKWNK